jgi:ABC-type hemin transport system ATPase subunit
MSCAVLESGIAATLPCRSLRLYSPPSSRSSPLPELDLVTARKRVISAAYQAGIAQADIALALSGGEISQQAVSRILAQVEEPDPSKGEGWTLELLDSVEADALENIDDPAELQEALEEIRRQRKRVISALDSLDSLPTQDPI